MDRIFLIFREDSRAPGTKLKAACPEQVMGDCAGGRGFCCSAMICTAVNYDETWMSAPQKVLGRLRELIECSCSPHQSI